VLPLKRDPEVKVKLLPRRDHHHRVSAAKLVAAWPTLGLGLLKLKLRLRPKAED
jgi:hypothetical protein